MAQAQRKIEDEFSGSEHPGRALPFTGGATAAPSPARTLQDQFLMAPAAAADRWPVGQRVALILSASLALWVAILHMTAGIAHAVA